MPFDNPQLSLGTLLTRIEQGKVQLPDFQRSWKWDVDRIASLIASISLGHPIGVVMKLEVGGADVRFKPRVLAGVDADAAGEPEELILDGQQRLTSLYQALQSARVVDTYDPRGKRLKRWFYLDIAAALDPTVDREDAVIAIPEDRVVRTDFGRKIEADYRTLDAEIAAGVFPLWRVLDNVKVFEWGAAYTQSGHHDHAAASERWNRLLSEVIGQFMSYTVPAIVLKMDTPKEAVCTVFEKVNTGGVALNVFELLTATFAADNFRLNDDWTTRRQQLRKQPVLHGVESTDFLQAVSLVATARRRERALADGADAIPAVSCRRKEILKLSLQDYRGAVDEVTNGFLWAARFLAQQKVFHARDIPYRTQLVPLAALRALEGSSLESHSASASIEKWYWCGVLGELYGGATETRFARDIEEVPVWLQGGVEPRTVRDAAFETSRLFTMRTRNSAAYKGIHALLMRKGSKDWVKNLDVDTASFFSQSIDIHHVFPKAWCAANNVDTSRCDSIVNKTPLSYDTNRTLGGRAPSSYLATVRARTALSDDALHDLFARHEIDLAALESDDFEKFFETRTDALKQVIASAMGKNVVEDDLAPSEADSRYEADSVEPPEAAELAA